MYKTKNNNNKNKNKNKWHQANINVGLCKQNYKNMNKINDKYTHKLFT